MFLCYSKLNTKSSLVILNFKTIIARSCIITNNKLFHTTFILNDSNDNQDNKNKSLSDKKLAKLKLISKTKLISLENVEKKPTSSLDRTKERSEFIKKGNEDVPGNLAKLIDRYNTGKTTEILLSPLQKLSKKEEKSEQININKTEMTNLK